MVGFAYNEHSCTPASSNHHSAIAEALDIEVTKWAIWIAHVIQEATCISRWVAWAQYCQDKWCLILNLSHPKGTNINDGIDHALY